MDYAVVGRIVNTHGVRGDVKVLPLMDQAQDLMRFESFHAQGIEQCLTPSRMRLHKGLLIVHFREIPDMDAAEAFRGVMLCVPKGDLPELEPGRYYLRDLFGLQVKTDTGETLGKVEDVLETGAHGVFSVRDDEGAEILLPHTDEIVLDIDLDAGVMLVHLIPGLRDEE